MSTYIESNTAFAGIVQSGSLGVDHQFAQHAEATPISLPQDPTARRAALKSFAARNRAVLAAGGIASILVLLSAPTAMAQAGQISASTIDGVVNVAVNADGTVTLTMADGQQMILQAQNVTVTPDGSVLVSEATAQAVAEAAGVGGAGGTGLAAGGMAGGAAAGVGGLLLAGAAAGGGGGGSTGGGDAPAPAVSGGSVVDGYIVGATVFRDVNNNLKYDAGVDTSGVDGAIVTTGETGGFEGLLDGTAKIVAVGGIDSSTGKAFTGVMTAPAGSTVITPLTTLVQSLVEKGQTAEDASATIASKLGLTLGDGESLLNIDPVAKADAGDTAALKAAAKIANVINLAAADADDKEAASEAASKALADALEASADGDPDPLTDEDTIKEAFKKAAEADDPDAEEAEVEAKATQKATATKTANDTVDAANDTDDIAAVQEVVQGQLVETAGSGGDLDDVDVELAIKEIVPLRPSFAGRLDGTRNAESVEDGYTVDGSGRPGSTVEVKLGTVTKTAVVDGENGWSVTFDASEIVTGDFTMTARAKDAGASASDPFGFARSVAVSFDVTPPAPPTAVNIDGDAVVSIAENGNAIFSGQTEAGATLNLIINSAEGPEFGTYEADVADDGSFTVTVPQAFTEGSYVARLQVMDENGNPGPDTTFNFVADLAGPAAPTLDVPTELNIASGATFNIPGTTEPNATVRVEFNGAVFSAQANASGEFTATFDVPGTDGAFDVTASAEDIHGNQGPTSVAIPILVDVTAPDAPVLDPIADLGGASGATFDLTGTAEPFSTLEVTYAGATTEVDVPETGSFSVTLDVPDDGEYTITAVAIDQAGNRSEEATATQAVDTVAPAAITELTVQTANIITEDGFPEVLYTGTAEPNTRVTVHIMNGEEPYPNRGGFGIADPAGTFSGYLQILTNPFSGEPLNGTYNIMAIAQDIFGNNAAPYYSTYTIASTDYSEGEDQGVVRADIMTDEDPLPGIVKAIALSTTPAVFADDGSSFSFGATVDGDAIGVTIRGQFLFNTGDETSFGADGLVKEIEVTENGEPIFKIAGLALDAGQMVAAFSAAAQTFNPTNNEVDTQALGVLFEGLQLDAYGSQGSQEIHGGTEDDTVSGASGDDTLHGGGGEDSVDGGAGADELFGDSGDDTLSGGSGDDTIDGGTGSNVYSGGNGADEFIVQAGTTVLLDFDFEDDDITFPENFTEFTKQEVIDAAQTTTYEGQDAVQLVLDDVTLIFVGYTEQQFEDAVEASDFGGDPDEVVPIDDDTPEAIPVITTNFNAPIQIYDTVFGALNLASAASFAANGGVVSVSDTAISIYIPANFGGNPDQASDVTLIIGGQNMALSDPTDLGSATGTMTSLSIHYGATLIAESTGMGIDVSDLIDAFDAVVASGEGGGQFDFSAVYALLDGYAYDITGSSGADDFSGDRRDDTLEGNSGDDTIFGFSGDDSINGGAGYNDLRGGQGDDTITGGSDDDDLFGNSGDDEVYGGTGYNYIVGGQGEDTLSGSDADGTTNELAYVYDPAGISADLSSGTIEDGWGDVDSVMNVDRIRGSLFDDSLLGGNTYVMYRGLKGEDTIDAGPSGLGIASYDRDYRDYYFDDTIISGDAGVEVNLREDTARDGFGDTDTLRNIHAARGTQYDDVFIADDSGNQFEGLDGDDTYHAGDGDDRFQIGLGDATFFDFDFQRDTIWFPQHVTEDDRTDYQMLGQTTVDGQMATTVRVHSVLDGQDVTNDLTFVGFDGPGLTNAIATYGFGAGGVGVGSGDGGAGGSGDDDLPTPEDFATIVAYSDVPARDVITAMYDDNGDFAGTVTVQSSTTVLVERTVDGVTSKIVFTGIGLGQSESELIGTITGIEYSTGTPTTVARQISGLNEVAGDVTDMLDGIGKYFATDGEEGSLDAVTAFRNSYNFDMIGSSGDDAFTGGIGDDTFYGSDGDDTYTTGEGSDEVVYNGGNDVITDFSFFEDDLNIDNFLPTEEDKFFAVIDAEDNEDGDVVIEMDDTGNNSLTLQGISALQLSNMFYLSVETVIYTNEPGFQPESALADFLQQFNADPAPEPFHHDPDFNFFAFQTTYDGRTIEIGLEGEDLAFDSELGLTGLIKYVSIDEHIGDGEYVNLGGIDNLDLSLTRILDAFDDANGVPIEEVRVLAQDEDGEDRPVNYFGSDGDDVIAGFVDLGLVFAGEGNDEIILLGGDAFIDPGTGVNGVAIGGSYEGDDEGETITVDLEDGSTTVVIEVNDEPGETSAGQTLTGILGFDFTGNASTGDYLAIYGDDETTLDIQTSTTDGTLAELLGNDTTFIQGLFDAFDATDVKLWMVNSVEFVLDDNDNPTSETYEQNMLFSFGKTVQDVDTVAFFIESIGNPAALDEDHITITPPLIA